MAPATTGKRKRTGKTNRPAREADEDEVRLAESLFGGGGASGTKNRSKKLRAQQSATGELDDDDEDEDGIADTHAEQYLDDDQLFILDTAAERDSGDVEPSQQSHALSASASAADDSDDDEEEETVDVSGHKPSQDDDNEESEAGPSSAPKSGKSARRRRKPVWTDPSSATLTVALAGPEAKAVDGTRKGTKRLRKLREAPDEQMISGTEYEMRLRRMFEKLHPRPRWAALELRGGRGKGGPSSTQTIAELLSSDVGLVNRVTGDSRRKQGAGLPGQQLQVMRLRDANEAQGRFELPSIEQLAFHPSSRENIMMTTSKDRKVRLFHVDGKDNPLLQTILVPDLPLHNAVFHPSGASLLLSGRRPYFYVHDMHAGTTYKSTHWRAFGGADDVALQARDLSLTRFSPASTDGGRRLAVGVRRGAIHLLDWGRRGGGAGSASGSLIGTLQMNSPLAGLTWDPAREHALVSLSQQGTVHTWDARKMSCDVQRTDVGLYAPSSIDAHPSGQMFVVGSEGGIVNVYGRDAVEGAGSTSTALTLEPLKAIRNIVTSTTSLQFNPTGEILGIASNKKKDALKLVHAESLNVFENWPTSSTPLGAVTALDFSSGSDYMAIGNKRGKVLLYSLTHYT